MSEPTEPIEVGAVKVTVSAKQVFRAVRQLLTEMNLDPAAVRAEVKAKADQLVHSEVVMYLHAKGYGNADLDARADRVLRHYEDDLKKKVKEVLKEVVAQAVQEQLDEAVEAVLTGIHFKYGWRNKRVKVTAVPPEKPSAAGPPPQAGEAP